MTSLTARTSVPQSHFVVNDELYCILSDVTNVSRMIILDDQARQ